MSDATKELSNALEVHKRNLPYFIEYEKLQAKVVRQKFLAVIKEGFTVDEALELCKDSYI